MKGWVLVLIVCTTSMGHDTCDTVENGQTPVTHNSTFDQYKLIRGAVSRELATFIGNTFLLAKSTASEDLQVPNSLIFRSPVIGESLLLKLRSLMERETGLSLVPTYSFARIYYTGTTLPLHTDRDACEISATLCLVEDPAHPWPLWTNTTDGVIKSHITRVGDLLMYKGLDVEHWREAHQGTRPVVQIFLHYVNKDGPYYPQEAYDKRLHLIELYESLHYD